MGERWREERFVGVVMGSEGRKRGDSVGMIENGVRGHAPHALT
jgi:hypothetical protein